MKKIIITGKDSYIGNHIQEWIERNNPDYTVTQVDVITDEWRNTSFKDTDVIIHVAGIVHHPEITEWYVYENVNVKLPQEIAEKAKKSGVKQFIFMSSMAVYGVGKKLHSNIITENTKINPKGLYGKSKFMAEKYLMNMADEYFHVSVVRPPNVYGYGCKGNYIPNFLSVVKKLSIIPVAYENVKQSMIYIDNLTEFIRLLIENRETGVFTPQDNKTISAAELMSLLAKSAGIAKRSSKLLGIGIYLLSFVSLIRKAYGGVEYDMKISDYFNGKYQVVSTEEAIVRTIKNV